MKSKNKINLTVLGQKKIGEKAPAPMRGRAQTFYTDHNVQNADSARRFEVNLGAGGRTDRKM